MESYRDLFMAEFGLKHGLPSHVKVNHLLKITDKELGVFGS